MIKNGSKIDFSTFVGEPSRMVGEGVRRLESPLIDLFRAPGAPQGAGRVGQGGEQIILLSRFWGLTGQLTGSRARVSLCWHSGG